MAKRFKRLKWDAWRSVLTRVFAIACGAYALMLLTMVALYFIIPLSEEVLLVAVIGALFGFLLLALALSVYADRNVVGLPTNERTAETWDGYEAELPDGFVRFKRKIKRAVILRAVAIGLSAGLLAVTVSLGVVRFYELDGRAWQYVLIGLGVAVLTAGVTFLIQYPANKRIAKRLDRLFGMNEKVQTMIAFRRTRGAMIALQREDVGQRLEAIPPKRFKQHSVWISFVAMALCAVLMTGTILIPATASDPDDGPQDPVGPVEEPFALTEWQITAMHNLIDSVRASDMDPAPREAIALELEALLEMLRTTDTVPAMKKLVIGVIVDAGTIADKANSYDDISSAMALSTSESTAALGEVLSTPDNPMLREQIDDICAGLLEVSSVESLSSFVTGIRRALADADVEATDALRAALEMLVNTLEVLPSARQRTAASPIEEAFAVFYLAVGDALSVQYANSDVATMVRNKLMNIFGILPSEIPQMGGNSGSDAPTQPPGQEGQHGAPGTGETIFGSKDIIYYPDDNVHLEYGDVIFEFNAKMQEQLQGNDYSDEMKEMIIKYFDALVGAQNADDNESKDED